MNLTRRNLLALTGGGLVPFAPGLNMAFSASASPQTNVLVVIFLRFGMDGLQLVAPADDAGYRDRRRNIGLRINSGAQSARPLGTLGGTQFFLHPQAGQLKQMFDNKSLAVVHAAGVPTGLRSHFEVQEMADKGGADNDHALNSGWLARHLAVSGATGDFAATADSTTSTSSLNGAAGILPTGILQTLGLWVTTERAALISTLNAGDSESERSARKTLAAIALMRDKAPTSSSTPNPNYTYGALSQKLQPLAGVIKSNLGVQLATVDFGGWDHHENLPGLFGQQARELSDALFAFTDDLGPEFMNRVTVVTMTEFGRRVQENASVGTDHGAASVMLALGAGVNGGKIYGEWPGLRDSDLDGGDLRVTTDYRQVLAELLVKRQGQAAIQNVFPTLPYRPLGLIG